MFEGGCLNFLGGNFLCFGLWLVSIAVNLPALQRIGSTLGEGTHGIFRKISQLGR